jgi:RHS repeat-associated protein
MTDNTSKVVWEGVYKPLGEASVNPMSTVVNNIRFPGQYYDSETELHYNYHRYYQPRTGRYVTPDPIGLNGGFNQYGYASNSPNRLIDEMGLRPGDIYLFKRTEGLARLIGILSPGGDYGHAAIELPGNRLLTASKHGTQIEYLPQAVRNAEYDVFRPFRGVDEKALREFARKAVALNLSTGERYDWSGFLGFNKDMPGELEVKSEYTCSQLVWEASWAGGNYLGWSSGFMPSLISPNDLFKSQALYKVNNGCEK